MSELKVYGMNDPKVGDEYEMYKVSEVDAVLAEKDAKIRKLKRALWMARAEMARTSAWVFWSRKDDYNYNKWKKVERKCRAKAKEYK